MDNPMPAQGGAHATYGVALFAVLLLWSWWSAVGQALAWPPIEALVRRLDRTYLRARRGPGTPRVAAGHLPERR